MVHFIMPLFLCLNTMTMKRKNILEAFDYQWWHLMRVGYSIERMKNYEWYIVIPQKRGLLYTLIKPSLRFISQKLRKLLPRIPSI